MRYVDYEMEQLWLLTFGRSQKDMLDSLDNEFLTLLVKLASPQAGVKILTNNGLRFIFAPCFRF